MSLEDDSALARALLAIARAKPAKFNVAYAEDELRDLSELWLEECAEHGYCPYHPKEK